MNKYRWLILFVLFGFLLGSTPVMADEPQPHQPPLPVAPRPQQPVRLDDGVNNQLLPGQTAAPEGLQTNALVPVGPSGVSFSYAQTYGVTGEPFLADGTHLDGPNGLFIDSTNSLYVAEEYGDRMLEYDSSGNNTLILGHAGLPWQWSDNLAYAKDVAVRSSDGHIFVLLAPAVKEFDSSGNLIQTFPATNPWQSGSDNGHFAWNPAGIAFGPGGYLYISDTNNQRIQVLDVSGATTSYVATIGMTGTPKADNSGFNQPGLIAFDSLGRLYVMDTANYRVQRCSSSNPWTAWSCSTFFGTTGVSGTDLSHIDWAEGIGISSTDIIFIADSNNDRVLKCNTSASCSLFAGATGISGADNSHLYWPADVAVDSSGNVFVSDYDNSRIQKFNSAGLYQSTLGVTGVPYLTDTSHLYEPSGVSAAPGGTGFYVTEAYGERLIKLNAAGVEQWTVGETGVLWTSPDNHHFHNPTGTAVDASGNVYVADSGNNRLQIFNSSGSYIATLGGYGLGNYQFNWPNSVAISPQTGDIYVTDWNNQRVQVYTSSRVYKTTLGVTGESGTDNLHFNNPGGVTIDSAGNIYVADTNNERVQKCILILVAPGYSCNTFVGVTGEWGIDFGHLYPQAVTVDSSNRVYIADANDSRIQVYDSTGAYLTTIAGIWGQGSSQLVNPSGVAVDSSGNVYVTDGDNQRVQRFSLGTPDWIQSNINGFGDPANTSTANALNTFGGQLYAGTSTDGTIPAQVWRSSDGQTWSQFSPVWASANDAATASQPFGPYDYFGTDNGGGCEIWRTDGSTWTQVVSGGFGDTNNNAISSFAVFSNQIYAVTSTSNGILHVYRSPSGDSGTWSLVVSNGFGGNGVGSDTSIYVYGGYLYIGLNRNEVAELWRTNNGTTWSPVFTNGLSANDSNVSSIANFEGTLYIGLRNVVSGGELWSSTNGTTFVPVFTSGLGNPDDKRPYGMYVFNGRLYLLITNTVTGDEVWRSTDGTNWVQVVFGGWGDANNFYSDYYDKGAVAFNNRLFFGTSNSGNGGEIWRDNFKSYIYLPLVIR